VFHQPLRQTEGLVSSLLELMGLDLPVPDHSTLSRRSRTLAVAPQAWRTSGAVHLLVDSTGVKLSGPGEWLVEKHGTQRRRAWRKLHLAVDARTGTIVASTLTTKEVDNAAACCTEEKKAKEAPFPANDQATRTEFGCPRSSIRLRTWAAMATSVARAWSLWKRSPSPMTCFQRANWPSTRALSL
jgi:Transposase DDE domain